MWGAFAAWVRRTPLALPLVALVGALLSLLTAGMLAWPWSITALALLLTLLLREWRILFACILVSAVGYVHLASRLQGEALAREALPDKAVVELRGHIVRESESSRFLQLADSSARVELRGDALMGHLGDEITLRGMVHEMQQDYLPGCFDRAAWLQSQGVVAQVGVMEMQLLPPRWNWARLLGISAECRSRLVRTIMPEGSSPDPRRQVLAALILGERRLSAPETLEIFQWSGTLHAFAVSGLHVGLIAGMLWFLLARLRVRYSVAAGLILLLLASYVFVTGMAVASQRAYLMIACFMLGFLCKRQIFVGNILCFVALLILLIDPRQLEQAGFLLSFLVYGGIIAALKKCRDDRPWFGPDEYIPRQIFTKWDERSITIELALRSLLIIALSAALVSLPLNLIFFSCFTTYSVLANICITPLLPLVMGAGLLMMLCSGIPVLAGLTASLALYLSGLLLSVCGFFAQLPAAYITTAEVREAQDFMLLALPYEQSACALGNPALIVHSTNESHAQWTLGPALLGAGFQPKLLVESARSTAPAASKCLQGMWKDLQIVKPTSGLDEAPIQHFSMGQNHYTIYPAPCLMHSPLMDDKLPLIHWMSPKGSLLYIGNASASSYEYWKEQGADLKAATIILGYNNKQPFLNEEELQALGCEELILLPSVPATLSWAELPAGIRVRRVVQGSSLKGQLIASSGDLSQLGLASLERKTREKL